MHANPVKNGRRNIQKIDRRASCRGQHSEAEMIGALKQMEAGRTAPELGVSKHTIYAWKAKSGGLAVNEAQRLRQLKDGTHRRSSTSTQSWYRDHWDEDCGAEQVILRLGNAGPPESVTLWAGEYDYHCRSRGSLP